MKKWNERIDLIKLHPVQGNRGKRELLAEISLLDAVPIQGVWDLSLGISNHLIMAFNLATSGFWWWVLPRHRETFFESIKDLENPNHSVHLERNEFKVFESRSPALTDVHIDNLVQCFATLPAPGEQDRFEGYRLYMTGLLFVSLMDVHWRCESQAFLNFAFALRYFMQEGDYLTKAESVAKGAQRFLQARYPDFVGDQVDKFVSYIDQCFSNSLQYQAIVVGDVYLIKLIAEGIFREFVISAVMGQRKEIAEQK